MLNSVQYLSRSIFYRNCRGKSIKSSEKCTHKLKQCSFLTVGTLITKFYEVLNKRSRGLHITKTSEKLNNSVTHWEVCTKIQPAIICVKVWLYIKFHVILCISRICLPVWTQNACHTHKLIQTLSKNSHIVF